MILKKFRSKDLLLLFFKTICFIVGLDIFLTSIFIILNKEININNLEKENNLNIKNFK